MWKRIVCSMLIMLTVLLTGCWNNREITSLAIVDGIGIDKTSDGMIDLTFQILTPSKSGSSSLQSGGSTVDVYSKGSTMFEAIRNMIPSLSKKAYLAQIQVLVIGDEMAKFGLDKIWDFFERDHETNKLMRLVVVKNGTAKSVLDAKADYEQIGASQLVNTIDSTAYGKNINLKSYQVTSVLSQPHAGLVIGAIDPCGASELTKMRVEGSAVFKNARLISYLTAEQTRGYVFAANQLKSTIINITNPKEQKSLVAVEVIKSQGKLSVKLKDGKPVFEIEVTASGNLAEEDGSADLADSKSVKELSIETEEAIKNNIQSLMDKSQKELDCDILNFSELLYKNYYNEYHKLIGSWDEVYKNASYNIKVQFTIGKSGMIKKPTYNKQ